MADLSRSLPDFEAPPVVEVALAVHLDPPLAMTSAYLGRLWEAFGDRFPRTEDQPPLPTVIEIARGDNPPMQNLRIGFGPVPPLPRCWFLNDAQTELIQIQSDKLIRNWRKVGASDVYPRYDYIRRTFIEEFKIFEQFVASEGLGSITPRQCEITYVNHIAPGSVWRRHGEIGKVIRPLVSATQSTFLSEPEDVRCGLRYVIRDDTGAFLGRLNVDAQPAFVPDGPTPIIVLSLCARGKPDGDGFEGVLRFLDRGRDWIVRGFADLTTEEMHTVWKRRA